MESPKKPLALARPFVLSVIGGPLRGEERDQLVGDGLALFRQAPVPEGKRWVRIIAAIRGYGNTVLQKALILPIMLVQQLTQVVHDPRPALGRADFDPAVKILIDV